MNPQVVTKSVKALLAVGAVFGIEVGAEHAETIVQGALSLAAVLYAAEAWWKRRSPQGK